MLIYGAVKFKTKPFKHQQEIFDRQKDSEIFAYLWDRGLGKSKIILDTAAHLYCTGKIDNLIVIGPKGAYFDWKYKHVPEHLSDSVGDYSLHQWGGATSKKEQGLLDYFVKPAPGSFRIFAINSEAFQYDKVLPYVKRFITSGKTMVCIDESHLFKNPTALRTRTIRSIFSGCPYKRIATGTVMERIEDIYSQFDFLKPGCLNFTRFTAFKQRYCIYKQMQFGAKSFAKVVGYTNLPELKAKMLTISSIIDKEDVFDLPPKIYQTLHVELSAQQRKHYKEMEKQFLTYINGKDVEANVAITMSMKLHQITCGVIHGNDDENHQIDGPNPKLDAIRDVLDEGRKTILFCNLSSNFALDMVYEELSKEYRCIKYYGGTSQEERRQHIKDFQEGDVQVFIANTTAAEGITLTKAKNVIYFSNSYSIIKRDQSEDRAHRWGVEHPVNIIDVIAIDTIDEIIVDALKNKKSLQEQLLAMKARKEMV